ncbi:tetrahydrofolate dehydrogenase/cyclohydrolase catalytic domain-containing protein [Streptosporangium canum]|uniref:tetrahydrofolate dehydrogenase/cyclohydrolase catalytic domain-containing protein n=1 Tax=Streptosporangium canum TaxID=324952 RepID=UPI0037ACC3CF
MDAGPDDQLESLSADGQVSGIILQTPLPGGVKLEDLASAIAPAKDVDGANPLSLGRLAAGLPAFADVGRAGLITAEHVKPGAVVVDVGTNPTDDGGLVSHECVHIRAHFRCVD